VSQTPAEPAEYLFLASAIAGSRAPVHTSRKETALACSDGQSILLPPVTLRVGRPPWADVIAQAVLIGAGSLAPSMVRKLLGRVEAARRYASLEVLRASHELAGRIPTPFLDLVAAFCRTPLTGSAQESLAVALSQASLPEPPTFFGAIRPLMILRKVVDEHGLTALLQRHIPGRLEMRKIEEFDEDQDTEESVILKLFQNPFSAGSNPLADLLQQVLGAGTKPGQRRGGSGEDGGGAELPVGRIERALRRGVSATLARLPLELPGVDVAIESPSLRYPEWDTYTGRYKRNWVVVEEVEPWPPNSPRPLEQLLPAPSPRLRRELSTLGLDHEMHRRQPDGTELDTDQLLERAIDLAAGHSPPVLDIYRATRRTRRDLGVAIALDISGSTAEAHNEGCAVFDQQLRVGYQLARTFDQLGDTVALFGFHSWGRQLVRAVLLKGAEEPWSALVAERLACLEPVGYTRTGAAIRHGTRLLNKAMRLPNRLLVLITDGIAYDQDYEDSYAANDARKALQEAQVAGTAVVCLCIGGSEDSTNLRDIFGAANLLIVDHADQIAPLIRRICRQALAAVSRRQTVRRRSQEALYPAS
jgi:nitric oxide reductase NorD protein